MVVWGLGRLFRGLDGILMMQEGISGDLQSRRYSWIYIVCYYVFVEFLPIACIALFDKVLESLDYGNDFNYLISQIAESERANGVTNSLLDPAEDGGGSYGPTYPLRTSTTIFTARVRTRDGNEKDREKEMEEGGRGDLVENLKNDPTIRSKLIPYSDLKILEYEGRANGGTVVKAQWGDRVVAVKRLDVILQRGDDLKPFYNELTILRYGVLSAFLSPLLSSPLSPPPPTPRQKVNQSPLVC